MLRHKLIQFGLCSFIVLFIVLASYLTRLTEAYGTNEDCPRKCKCLGSVVNCASKSLSFFPRDLPTWCTVLLLSGNKLESLNSENRPLIPSPANLTQIDLSNAQLHQFDSDFFLKLFNDIDYIDRGLKILKLDENELKIFPRIKGISNLKTLSIASNYIETVSDVDLELYPLLELLDLSSNSIKYIPKHFLANKSIVTLTSLNLQNNGIMTIEKGAFELFPNLQVLKLAKNNLVDIPKEFFGPLTHLKELDLNFNQIEKITSLAFNNLDSLQILRLRRNRLNHLQDGSFYGLAKLVKLHLDHNDIPRIYLGWTFGLKSLTELTIRYNNISEITAGSWNESPKIVELHLNHNKLNHIDKDAFFNLRSLQVLKLSNNLIKEIDADSFAMLTSLELLDLSSNELSSAIEVSNGLFAALRLLKKLRLDNNQIKLILKHTFIGLDKLTMLNMTGNPISSIQSDSFQLFQNLKELHLDDSDLLCDCTLKWFFQWLQTSELRKKFAKKIRCKYPHELYLRTERSFLNANINDFKCQDFLKPYLMDDFSSIDKPISAIKNKNITFYCKVASGSVDPVQFKWLKDNQIVNHDRAKFETLRTIATENVTHYTNVFTVAHVQDQDEGNYHCMASNNFGTVYSHKFKVNVYIIPYFIKEPQNITVKVGHTARLECSAHGQPAPVISWQKDGGDSFPAAMERRMHVMPTDHVFFIVEVKKIDLGWYTCNATNDAGSVITTAFLDVYEPPSFVRKMNDKKALVGSTVSLECMAAGIPMPNVTWSKNGVLLEATDRHFFTAESQLLIIVKLKHSDSGRYSCNISNAYGHVQDSSELEIFQHLNSDNPSLSDNFHKKNNGDDMLNPFISLMRTRGIILIIVILCVMSTSLIWILVICYIRKRQKSFGKSNTNVEEEEDSDELDEFDSPRSDHLKLSSSKQVFPHFHPNTELDFDGLNSESSSAKDTGIEGSCKSNEDESDQLYSFDPYYYHQMCMFRSLPRRNLVPIASPVVPEPAFANMSLPRNTNRDPQYDVNKNGSLNNIAMSSKEKKRLLKKIKHQQMMCTRKHTDSINEVTEQSQPTNPTHHQYVSENYYPQQVLQTFSAKSNSSDDVSHD